MASRRQILPALGNLEWEAFGGKIHSQRHPSGRVSYTYVAPDGKKIRSWKLCLVRMGENESGPIAQKARERQKGLMKNPRAFKKNRQRKNLISSSSLPTGSEGQQATEAGDGVAPVIGILLQSSPPEGKGGDGVAPTNGIPTQPSPPEGNAEDDAGDGVAPANGISSQSSPPKGNHSPKLKSEDLFPDAVAPPASGEWQQATWAGVGMTLYVGIPSQSSPPEGNHSPESKSKDLFPDAATPPPTGESSLPDSMTRRKEGDPKETSVTKSINCPFGERKLLF